jgi:DNA (cytosine-5)-methyltransferase 1
MPTNRDFSPSVAESSVSLHGDTPKLRVLDLFSGIGGFSLGLERTGGFETVAFCEIEDFCRRVLAKHWPEVPCFEDIRTLRATDVEPVDVITGGFPCQDISNAGRRAGLSGAKSGLWQEMRRLIDELRPAWVIIENSAHGRRHWLGAVISDLDAIGYQAAAMEIAAHDIGHPHERRRVWVLADAGSGRHRLAEEALRARRASPELRAGWPDQPGVPGVDDGLPSRVDRRRALGNAVVTQIPEAIGQAILAARITA